MRETGGILGEVCRYSHVLVLAACDQVAEPHLQCSRESESTKGSREEKRGWARERERKRTRTR